MKLSTEPGTLHNGVVAPAEFERTRDLAGPELAASLDIPTFGWSIPDGKSANEAEAIRELGPEDDPALAECGKDKLQGSMLVLASDGVAYCILGVDTSSSESFFAAEAIAKRLTSPAEVSDRGYEYMRARIALAFADEGTAEFEQAAKDLESLRAEMSQEEKEWADN